MLELLEELNSGVFFIRDVLIFFVIISVCTFFFSNFKKYKFRKEISNVIKLTVTMVAVAFFLNNIMPQNGLNNIFNYTFYHLINIIILIIVIMFLGDKFVWHKINLKNFNIENRYITCVIYLNYFFILISTLHGIEPLLFSIMWQMCFVSGKFTLTNNMNEKKNEKFDALYESRKEQLKRIEETIKDSDYNGDAIALNGEWGSGKTQLLEALIERSQIQSNYYIYIKPMIADTRESLIHEFEKSLIKIMNESGVYCGKSSSLEKYFKEVLQLIQFNSKVSLNNIIKSSTEEKSYKELKLEVQKDIDSLLNKTRRLVIIIDDFDRVDKDKQLEILAFIKEIVDFKGCIVLFALDYNNIVCNSIVTGEYLEKFIATKIQLSKIDLNELLIYHSEIELDIDKELNKESTKILLKELKNNIYTYFDEYENYFTKYNNAKDDKGKEKQEQVNKIKKYKNDISYKLNNSRRVIHFLKEIKNSLLIIDSLYEDNEKINMFFKDIDATRLIYLMNFIKVFYMNIYNKIINNQGIEILIDNYSEEDAIDEERYIKFLIDETIPYVNERRLNEKNQLIQQNRFYFIKDIFINYEFINNNIKLMTKTEELLKKIDDNLIDIENNFIDNILVYNRVIFNKIINEDSNEELIKKRILTINKYVISELYMKNKISFDELIQLIGEMYDASNIKFCIYSLKEIDNLIKSNEIKINEIHKKNIVQNMSKLERNAVVHYRYVFVELLNIALLLEKKEYEIENKVKNIEDVANLAKELNEWCIQNKILNESKDLFSIDEVLNSVCKIVEKEEYKFIDIKFIRGKKDEFLLITNYINKISTIEPKVESNMNYETLSQFFFISGNFNELSMLVEDLNSESIIDSYMVGCFQNILLYIVANDQIKSVDTKFENNIISFYEKIKKFNYNNEYQMIDISVNMERIVNKKLNKIE